MKNELDIIIPVSIDVDWPTKDSVISDILDQNKNYGFTRFALESPGAGWRSIGLPPEEFYVQNATLFKEVAEEVSKYGIECGWWITLTFKSGKTEGVQSIVRSDGSEHPFSNCPLSTKFKEHFCKTAALFCKIAKPAFVILEDDYSLNAADGCYCDLHLAEFEKRYGFSLCREDLLKKISGKDINDADIVKKWRKLNCETMINISSELRKAIDVNNPEIQIGYMQPAACDKDGDCTEEFSRALAGERHKPFSRLYGATYAGIIAKEIPEMTFHMLYSKQHVQKDFSCYYEADTFPHTRFYSASCQMMAAMAMAFSYGFDGATFQTQQLLDGANEEVAYGKAFAKERNRFNELNNLAKKCILKGVGIKYDPFWNTFVSDEDATPYWVRSVSRFGIPYTSCDSNILFWDDRQTKYLSDKEIKSALAKTLFLDSDAAKALCERGFGKYLGINIGEDIKQGKLQWDLASREIIKEPYCDGLRGKNITSPWMLAPKGNGKLPFIEVIHPNCEIISEYYTYTKELVTPAMTKFKNSLGGTVIVMGLTVKNNYSQALFNYRRKHILQKLIIDCCDELCLIKDAPDVIIIENVANEPDCDFKEMLTIINTCEDSLDSIALHLPPSLRDFCELQWLDINGQWQTLGFDTTADGIIVRKELDYCSPLYLKIK